MARRRYTLDEYTALKTAYGHTYSTKDLFVILMKPFLFIGIYTFLLYYYWWLSIIFGALASFYQYRRIMVLNAKREYETEAFNQRNRFINNLTQILTNEGTTTINGIIEVKDRTKGEFKRDLTTLITRLSDSDPESLSSAFADFKKGYESDVIFIQYVDQLETAMLDGRTNIEILKDIRSFHNAIGEKRGYFLSLKQTRKSHFIKIVLMLLLAVIAITLSLGITDYINDYAHTPFGWIGNTLFLLLIFLVFRTHLKKQEDDNVMEVEM